MNATFSSRLGQLRGRRLLLVWMIVGTAGLLLVATVLAISDESHGDDEMRTAHGHSADPGVPGFAGALPESASPARDGAPPVAMAPLAGAIATDMPLAATRPVQALADHPFFARHVGLGRVDCKLPAWRDEPEAARAFYRAAIACLDASWEPSLRGAGLPFHPPRLLAPAQAREVTGSCLGERHPVAAYYCAADETLVLPFDTMRATTASSRRGAQLAVLTTEYGHHVQAVIGVMHAYTDKRTAVGWHSTAGQEQSRRMELQARCFSGMFLGTNVGRGDIDQQIWNEASRAVRELAEDPAGERLRGTADNVWGWWQWGSDKGDTWECNTWFSSASNVE